MQSDAVVAIYDSQKSLKHKNNKYLNIGMNQRQILADLIGIWKCHPSIAATIATSLQHNHQPQSNYYSPSNDLFLIFHHHRRKSVITNDHHQQQPKQQQHSLSSSSYICFQSLIYPLLIINTHLMMHLMVISFILHFNILRFYYNLILWRSQKLAIGHSIQTINDS